MTLIYTLAGRLHIVQASDRRVTIAGRESIHDPTANKTIVVRGPDFGLTLSYTGLAYLDGLPTDVYLATRLLGLESARGADWVWRKWQPPRHYHFAWVISSLCQILDEVYARQPITSGHGGITLALGALHSATPRATMILGAITKRIDAPATYARANLDVIRWDSQFGFLTHGSPVEGEEDALRSGIASTDGSAGSAGLEMAQSIRRASAHNAAVGPDVLTVSISVPGDSIEVEYFPTTSAFMRGTNEWASPWIICGDAVMAPARFGPSTLTIHAAGTTVALRGPVGSGPGDFVVAAQPRVPPPGSNR